MDIKKLNLSAHIASLRAKEAASPRKENKEIIVFWGTAADQKYLPYLKGCVGSVTTLLRLEPVTTLTTVQLYCSQRKITKVISTSPTLLCKLLHWDKRKQPSLSNYAGSYFTIPGMKEDDLEIEVVFISPLKQLATIPYGKFMATRLITKLTKPEKWYKPSVFKEFHMLDANTERALYYAFEKAFLIAIDIETFRENATIRCLSYTAFFEVGGAVTFDSISVVLPLDSEYNLSIMRKWNLLPAPKVFQNGKYDVAYLARYNAPVYNYLYDTANLFHCTYSELPKDLGFLNAFFIREAVYWKDLAETNDLHEYYRYNALDTWGTGNAFLAMLLEAPAYAIQNYLLEFPLVFPCHMAEMIGIERDMDTLEEARAEQQKIIDTHTASLNIILGVEEGHTFNTNSTPQVKSLLKILGCTDLPKTDEKCLKKARFRHPFNARIINHVIRIRKARKLVSTYLTPGKEFSRQDGTGSRILFSLNPHGTDTSRLASREHHFWCGLQAQNIPRGKSVKRTLRADKGFYFAEVDLEQAESRDTAYISGDNALIKNVEHSPDFHCANASAFFGIAFEKLYDVVTSKKLNTKIRDIAKNVNHGANYNMGPYVLIDTMGEENIVKAKKLLELPRFWTYMQVAEYLLEQFHKTYPDIRDVFYTGVVEEILTSKKLTSAAVHYKWTAAHKKTLLNSDPHLEGVHEAAYKSSAHWTRYCFSDPSKSKSALNSYIAHPPQSLNAQTLNKAYLPVFHDIAMSPKHGPNFKLGPQIHDSILFQYREGHRYICEMVKERMEIPVTIKAYDGEVRTFVVPAGIKAGTEKSGNVAKYWSQTE